MTSMNASPGCPRRIPRSTWLAALVEPVSNLELAVRLGCRVQRVRQAARRYGIHRPGRRVRQGPVFDAQVAHGIDSGLSRVALAHQLGCSARTVCRACDRLGRQARHAPVDWQGMTHEIQRLLDAGYFVYEICQVIGVSRRSYSRAVRRLGLKNSLKRNLVPGSPAWTRVYGAGTERLRRRTK
jgi:hypothetical protein